ncbi:MAG: hypothetical protein FI707_15585 [SAR202 cluster bacterium]|nr:hypothetical protein [Chloroflexota bacterium]MDP6420685.1 virulence factor [SAR202 cluster bacterium]HAL48339.1 hypothetical protein [Dehalococcoidia bacterium]MDP6662748.1 virulence factor [SAR202 cluster bacterium]MDP6799147.1 virulence factor [SAR202 cluster bacterium]
MAKVRIMYWKEIPVQVQAEDDDGVVSAQLDERFQQGVDSISMFDGSAGSDDYLTGWEWGQFTDVDGTARPAAEALAERLNLNFPADFVSRVKGLHDSNQRNPTPGAVDHWLAGWRSASSNR